MKTLPLLITALSFLAFEALAEPVSFGSRYRLLPGDGACYTYLEVENRFGPYNFIETFETDLGPVTVKYETVGGHNPTDHDLIDVLATPDGVLARPMHIDLPDGDTGLICLMEYIGG